MYLVIMPLVLAIALLIAPVGVPRATAIAAAAAPSSAPTSAQTEPPCRLDTNLVRDATFEGVKGLGAWKPARVKARDKAKRAAEVVVYGEHADEWPGLNGCDTCELSYLRLAVHGAQGGVGVEQMIDIARFASDIDGGHLRAALGGQLGALVGSDTTAVLQATFLGAKGEGALGNPRNPVRLRQHALTKKPVVGTASLDVQWSRDRRRRPRPKRAKFAFALSFLPCRWGSRVTTQRSPTI